MVQGVNQSLALSAADRLRAIEACGLLETAAIPALDRVVHAAAELLSAPVAQLNVITADRQIPISYLGGGSWGQAVPVERSFCQEVIARGGPLVVRHAQEDSLVSNTHAVVQNGVAAGISVPIRSPRAADPIATLCVVDFRPRDWTDADVRRLQDLAAWARSEIELRAEYRDLRLRSEAALEASETRLRLALESAQLGAWDLELASGRMECTPQCKANFGRDAEAPFDYADLLESIHPEDRALVRAAVEGAVAGQTDYEVEYRVRRPNGTEHWIAARGTAFYDVEGHAVRMSGVTQDVTERIRARVAVEESEARFRALADLSPDAILVNTDGLFTYSNESAARLFGASDPEYIAGRSPYEFIGKEHHDLVRERIGATLEEGMSVPRVEQRWIRIDGSSVDVDVSTGPIVWRGVSSVQMVVRDVTERNRLDEELRRAKSRAEEASRTKGQFLAEMSHELRTPLNAILGYADLLLAETRGPITSGQEHQIERIKQGGRHLLDIIEEIQTYSRLEAGKEEVRLGAVDAAGLIRDAAEMVRPIIEQKGLEFRLAVPERPLPIWTDTRKMRQVVLNLLSNAAKFTDGGGVALEAVQEEDMIRIDVSDTGRGIPTEEIGAIWEPFRQARSPLAGERGGTGLGLSVSLQLARLLGGDITVKSARGEGSTFTLTLPVRPASMEHARDVTDARAAAPA